MTTIKTVLLIGFLMFFTQNSFAWDGPGYGHNGSQHHRYIRNPDLTLVSGMDTIDSRVLIAGPGCPNSN